MSGTGRVEMVFGASVPNTNEAARCVIVRLEDGRETSFYVPPGDDPPVGALISWGPHHAWDGHGWHVRKLSWEADPNAPLR